MNSVVFSQWEMLRALTTDKIQFRRPVLPMRGLQTKWLDVAGITASPMLRMTVPKQEGDHIGAFMQHPASKDPTSPLGPYQPQQPDVFVKEKWALSECAKNSEKHKWQHQGYIIWYHADSSKRGGASMTGGPAYVTQGNWRAAGSMPEWVARVRIRINSVGVERLNTMSREDASREGEHGNVERALYSYKARGVEFDQWVWVYNFTLVWVNTSEPVAPRDARKIGFTTAQAAYQRLTQSPKSSQDVAAAEELERVFPELTIRRL